LHGLGCFVRFCGTHVVETAVVVVLVPSACEATLLLGRCSGIGGCLGKLLEAFIRVMTHSSTFIAGYRWLILWGDGDRVAFSPWASIY
jgi:hypothetical protein